MRHGDDGTESHHDGGDTCTDQAVAYLRVSTIGQQENAAGLDQQLDEVQAYCRERGYELDEAGVFEDVVSGARDDREGYYQLLRRIEQQDADVIVAYDIDRFGRNNLDNAWLLTKAKEFGFRLETANGGTGDYLENPESELMFDIMSAIAKYERNAIRARLTRGKEKAHERGYWPSGQTPFGLKAKGPKGKKKLVADENAKHVRTAFRRYANGATLTSIAKELRDLELEKHPNREDTHKIMRFPAATVSAILDRVEYAGMLEYDGEIVEGAHDPIVPPDLWEAVRERRDD